ncbi:MAG: RHS repeat-associated core domain-containing protein [Oscillatoria sp. PMC 1051.18]|nr:RHS repeat-associated core domain-containing protein [Oscillatoria sp. PMC 1050.18]MEC5032988.1 RHS repeat-associated core domain-containing protein [Oscillatoria sp. PMC 1051.18]
MKQKPTPSDKRADGKFVRYGYDTIGNLTELVTNASTTEYSYDALNRLDQVKESDRILADYDYDAVGNLIQTSFGSGIIETRDYDSRNRLIQLETHNAASNLISSYDYTLDRVGNRLQVVEENGRIVDYTYDELHRLRTEKITIAGTEDFTISYDYDLVGNRLSRNDSHQGLTTYIYDANNRLTQTTQGETVTQFTYDNNGSLILRENDIETVSYDWANDGENRLLGVSIANSNGISQSQYTYDAFGNRVESVVDGVTTNYLVSGTLPQVLLEYDLNGQVTSKYSYGLDLIRAENVTTESYYLTDGLGSTRLLSNNTGEITDRYNYDAYGVLLSATGISDNSYQFAGEQRDSETNLDYLRARYYDPSLGRFISADPFAGLMSDPMSQHDYQYAHANPVLYTDPTGYFSLGEVMTTISLIGIGASIWSSVGYVGYQYLNGSISDEEVYGLYGQWAVGFADGASGGISTDVWSGLTGEVVTPENNFLWRMGMLAGVSTSMLIGLKVPISYTAKISQASWLATWQVVTEGYGAGKAIAGLADGEWEWNDVWNTLSLLPIASAMLGPSSFVGANRTVQGVDEGADGAVLGLTETRTTIEGRDFAHGTSLENIDNIINNGINNEAAKANSKGGLVNRPGSFFTVPLPQNGGIQTAYEFGLRHSDQPAVLIMRVPENIFHNLEANNQVFSRPIAGAENMTETIFRPESFDTLNQYAEFPQVIDPYGRR